MDTIQNFKHKKNLWWYMKTQMFQIVIMGAKAFVHVINKGDAFLIYVFPNQMLNHINMKSFFIQNIQGCVLKEEC